MHWPKVYTTQESLHAVAMVNSDPPLDASLDTWRLEQFIAPRLEAVQARIGDACRKAGRNASEVTLVAVSKKKPPESIVVTCRLGQQDFGESYVDEGVAKITAVHAAGARPRWHFIGPIQSNKTARIASHFDAVHSVDRAKIARRLNSQRSAELPPLEVYVQVHIGAETTKRGVHPDQAAELVAAVRDCERLRLRGLMCIPPPAEAHAAQLVAFRELQQLGKRLGVSEFSMGMSNDLEAAIEAGATVVRVGTDIFGPREA